VPPSVYDSSSVQLTFRPNDGVFRKGNNVRARAFAVAQSRERLSLDISNNEKLQIRMLAGYREVAERKESLVAGACNRPNCLVLPLSLELIRLAA
jgi:hypothetical protein